MSVALKERLTKALYFILAFGIAFVFYYIINIIFVDPCPAAKAMAGNC